MPTGPLPKPPSPVVELVAGWGFAAARLGDGSVWYWGHWLDGPDQARPIPTSIERSEVVGMAASRSESYLCLSFAKGGVECLSRPTVDHGTDWTDGWANKFHAEPVAPALSGAAQVALGSYRGCARSEDGTARCWTFLDQPRPPWTRAPSTIAGVDQLEWLGVGSDYACALRRDHTVQCWGGDEWGQQGRRDYTGPQGRMVRTGQRIDIVGSLDRAEPSPVDDLGPVDQLVVGGSHNCVLKDGGVWCWGFNADGQLGDGTHDSRSVPRPVAELSGVVELAAGHSTTCARHGDGTVRCWGHDLLSDSFGHRSARPVAVVPGLDDAAPGLVVGSTVACVPRRSGAVACWGSNRYGQLGDGSRKPSALSHVRWPRPSAR